jgi:two-component system chemotaxis sensor kinase CheA
MSSFSSGSNVFGDLSDFRRIFFEEADEHLSIIENLLLQAEKATLTPEHLNEIFRAAHSIKGSSGMLGFTELVSLTHGMENLLDLLRKGERPVGQRDIEAMLRAGDLARLQVAYRRGTSGAAPQPGDVEAELRACAADAPGAHGPRRFAVRLGPLGAPIAQGELEMLMAGLADLGTLHRQELDNQAGGTIRFELDMVGMEADLVSILSLVVAPELVQVARQDPAPATLQRGAGAPDAEGGEMFVDPAEFRKRRARGAATAAAEPPPPGSAPQAAVAPAGADPADPAIDLFVQPGEWRARRASTRAQRSGPGRRRTDYEDILPEKIGRREVDRLVPGVIVAEGASIRVSVEKIDRLVNLAGELVITEAMLSRSLARQGLVDAVHGESLPGLSDLARHTRNLQDAVMSVRMVPIATVFARFPRLARELSQRLGKEAEVRISGEATELDRGLIEKITDPLTHLVRNAIDHGLETPEARVAAGKPRAGVIMLSASQRGGNIVIEVRDDGGGLDRERILARAQERGLGIAPGTPDRQLWQVLFESGFSTAKTVTDVSGRGVGLDVVHRNIQTLGGSVDLASQAGQGTTVTLSVPLTLAIMEAMTVGSCGETYVLPLTAVVESRRLARSEVHDLAGCGQTLRVRDEHLPVLRLAELFPPRAGAPAATEDIALIVETEGGRAAVVVDELIGQQQVVVKSLEANFRRVAGLAGATIMGDGKVALILDMGYVVRYASHRAHA